MFRIYNTKSVGNVKIKSEEYEGLFQAGPIRHAPFLRSAILAVNDFWSGDFAIYSLRETSNLLSI